MKLWILSPVKTLQDRDNPWKPWYDKAFGFVVRAETEEEARRLANEKAGDENRYEMRTWLDSTYSTCKPLTYEGTPEVVMRDFASA